MFNVSWVSSAEDNYQTAQKTKKKLHEKLQSIRLKKLRQNNRKKLLSQQKEKILQNSRKTSSTASMEKEEETEKIRKQFEIFKIKKEKECQNYENLISKLKSDIEQANSKLKENSEVIFLINFVFLSQEEQQFIIIKNLVEKII